MYGAIIGDIVGSRFEFNNIKTKDFEFITKDSHFTDDTVLTLAIADYFNKYGKTLDKNLLINIVKSTVKKYINAGYGPSFLRWVNSSSNEPYNSYGNGAAMRVSPVSYVASSLEECKVLSDFVTSITHNHIEGLKGAFALSSAIFLLLNGKTKQEIKTYIETNFYTLDFNYLDLVKNYKFEISCQKSVPQALYIFLISTDFIDALKNIISIGGDSDTLSDMVLALAEAYYLNPKNEEGYKITSSLSIKKKEEINNLFKESLTRLDKNSFEICRLFNQKYNKNTIRL